MNIKLISVMLAVAIVASMTSTLNACECYMSSGQGRFCGRTLNRGSSGCINDNIYQCGSIGGTAESLGHCSKGCIETPAGQNDVCRT